MIVDAEAKSDLDRLLRTRLPNWPILVLSSCFDSLAWVKLFKAGASEIISDPLHPQKMEAALEGLLHQKEEGDQSGWNRLTHRLGMR